MPKIKIQKAVFPLAELSSRASKKLQLCKMLHQPFLIYSLFVSLVLTQFAQEQVKSHPYFLYI